MTKKRERLRNAEMSPDGALITGPRVGWIAGWRGDTDGSALVDFAGNSRGPLPARSTVALCREEVIDVARSANGVVLLFEEGDAARRLIMGMIQQASETPLLDLGLESAGSEEPDEERPREVHVDGERVVLEGRDEIVFRCGKASITLRRNGKVVIRGTYLVSRAEGTNRVRGGSVQIN